MSSLGVNATAHRMDAAELKRAHGALAHSRTAALARQPPEQNARSAFLRSTALWHITNVRGHILI